VLALAANDCGYVLVDTFELGVSAVADEMALSAAEELLIGLDIQSLVVDGAVDEEKVRVLADQGRVVVWRRPEVLAPR
jgi:hypothetical protein